MKLLQKFRKQASREDMEAQAAQELDAALAARPGDIPAMTPAPGLPGDDLNGSAGAETGETGEGGGNGDTSGPITDLPERRPASTRRTGARKPASGTKPAAKPAGTKTRTTAKPGAAGNGDKMPAGKPAARKAGTSSAGGTPKKRTPTSRAGTATRSAGAARQATRKR